ncbi:hypothetical protein OIU78_002176 [Salix suchowensis]|nr:hypothetical protein OIU78_002176 [Salix suchowensis]
MHDLLEESSRPATLPQERFYVRQEPWLRQREGPGMYLKKKFVCCLKMLIQRIYRLGFLTVTVEKKASPEPKQHETTVTVEKKASPWTNKYCN